MGKFRGTRGRRDYIKEAAELKKPAKILAILCACVFFATGALFLYTRVMQMREDTVAFVQPAFLENYEHSLYVEDMTDMYPLIPLHQNAGIFYDVFLDRLIFPTGALIGRYENFYRRNFYFVFDENEIEFSHGFVPLMQFDGLPIYMIKENNRLMLRADRGALTRYGSGAGYSYVTIIDPREIYHTIVVLDAGHGGRDPGAPNVNGPDAPTEAEINLAILHYVLDIFHEPGVLIIPTRSGDYSLSSLARTQITNTIGDYLISIHGNADAQNRSSRGTLSLYGSADGSEDLGEIFQSALVSALGSQDRGIRYAPQFYILRYSDVPSVILELLFLSNPDDATQLADPETQRLIAHTIAETIAGLPPIR